jgi:hypothetical protein
MTYIMTIFSIHIVASIKQWQEKIDECLLLIVQSYVYHMK